MKSCVSPLWSCIREMPEDCYVLEFKVSLLGIVVLGSSRYAIRGLIRVADDIENRTMASHFTAFRALKPNALSGHKLQLRDAVRNVGGRKLYTHRPFLPAHSGRLHPIYSCWWTESSCHSL